ncbi:MAG: hypothetical protein HC785_21155 [Calothrix sp. CSU_2_0]|nr:hypothetical protein [Calothrix sp. CSU_2_0]
MASQILTDPEKWCETYELASQHDKYSLLMEALEEALPQEIIKECDLGMLLVELKDEFESNNLITEFLSIIEKVQQLQPELYAQEFAYLNDLRVEYYLFRNQLELIDDCLTQFKANPVSNIDQMMSLIDYLRYYGVTEVLVDLCEISYEPVKNSDDIIPGTEVTFIGIILLNLAEKIYQKLQQGETVDWESTSAVVNRFNPETGQKWLVDIRDDLTTEIEINQQFFADYKKNQKREKKLVVLSTNFFKYMATEKQIKFITSQAIWESVLEFIESRELSNKQLEYPDSYFAFTEQQLDKYLGRLLNTLLSNRRPDLVAVIWGIPYIYEFLHQKEIIREGVYNDAIAATKTLKTKVIKLFETQLWKYDFVHRWLPPNSISEVEFTTEANLFATSIEKVTPLAIEPGQGVLESFYKNLEESAIFKDLFTSSEIDHDLEEDVLESPAQVDIPQFKPAKPPKKRKSPLMQAAELPDKKGNSSKSKKKN